MGGVEPPTHNATPNHTASGDASTVVAILSSSSVGATLPLPRQDMSLARAILAVERS